MDFGASAVSESTVATLETHLSVQIDRLSRGLRVICPEGDEERRSSTCSSAYSYL
jgi:hypothetical protein